MFLVISGQHNPVTDTTGSDYSRDKVAGDAGETQGLLVR